MINSFLAPRITIFEPDFTLENVNEYFKKIENETLFSLSNCSDTLYRLSFSLKLYEKMIWEANEPIIEMCKTKGASDIDCHNYVMVLQNFGNQLYVCGTHAFSPQCSWRQVGFWFFFGIITSIMTKCKL